MSFRRWLNRLLQIFSRIRMKRDPRLKLYYNLARESIPKINSLLGLNYTGEVVIKIGESDMNVPAVTSGNIVTVNPKWFDEHPGDDGAIIHELVHVVMQCPRLDSSNWWMIEGIADYVRDKLGYTTSWSTPIKGDPKGGYQATAHLLLFLEERFGVEYIRNLAKSLSTSGDLPDDLDSKNRSIQNILTTLLFLLMVLFAKILL